MKADLMTWVQRLVGLVFLIAVLALAGAIFVQVRQAEGIPPMPIFLGLLGLSVLILLAGACMALMSMAGSAKRSADALHRMARQGGGLATAPVAAATTRPFSTPMAEVVADAPEPQRPVAPARPLRPSGRTLVAER